MAIYEWKSDELVEVVRSTFAVLGIREREDVQRQLRTSIEIISANTMIIAEEFGRWEDSRRRIDLLGLTKNGRLVVIELKRTEDGGHMELQALRYAAMVSTMRFEQAVEAHRLYLRAIGGAPEDAERNIRRFLEVEEDVPVAFSREVKIVLAAADFHKEITSTVIWLNQKGLDISCVRLRPHQIGDHLLLDVQQLIPLPEAAAYQVAIREKSQELDEVQSAGRDFTKYHLTTALQDFPRLNKRRFIFEVVKEAFRLGKSVATVRGAVPWREGNMFLERAGQVTGEEVMESHPEKSRSRFFCGDDEVFFVDGISLVMSNQWGANTELAASNIIDTISGNHGMSFEALVD